MASISWNQFNDSSQMSEASSDEGPPKKNQDSKQNLASPGLQKTISSPEPTTKSHKINDNDKNAANLEKLERHQGETVWLFVTDNYSNRQIDPMKILKQNPIFESVVVAGKGYNLQVKTSDAANFIQRGHYQKGVNFKFIYSRRNQQRDYKDSKKIQKKYSQKSNQYAELKSPKIKTRQTYNQKSYKDQYEEKGDKKKVKYVAKENTGKKTEEIQKPLEPIKEKSESNKETDKTISREQSKQDSSKDNTEIDKTQSNEKQQQNRKNLDKKPGFSKKDSEFSDDERSQKQAIQKKKKDKKKKKGKSGGSTFADPNNPFSSLM